MVCIGSTTLRVVVAGSCLAEEVRRYARARCQLLDAGGRGHPAYCLHQFLVGVYMLLKQNSATRTRHNPAVASDIK
eukprot:4222381-Amphidinium_carterae.1